MNEKADECVLKTKIKEQSRAWLIYLYSGDVEQKKLEKFKDWLNTSELHRQAFESSERVWRNIGLLDSTVDWTAEVGDQNTVVPINIDSIDNATTNSAALNNTERDSAHSAKNERNIWRGIYSKGIAASFAILVIGALVVGGIISTNNEAQVNSVFYSSEVAQNLDIELSDGSRVTLAGDSVIVAKITDHRRDIVLKKGRAYFDVSHDAYRVFSVTADNTQVRVKGTAFDVRLGVDNVRVSVTQGLVEVAGLKNHDGMGGNVRSLTKNEQILAKSDGSFIGNKSRFNKESDLAWLDGRFVFDGVPLREVIADINRYYNKTIVIRDTEINHLQITTSFQAKQIDQVLAGLGAAYPVMVEHNNDQVLILAATP